MPGRLLVEHLGNALDLSESSAADYNPDTRRFYFMDPKDMTSNTVTEFLKGQPATGKTAADISSDQRKIVFQDWADQPRLYEANLDGTGFHRIPIDCTCQLLYPDYDPTATKIVYVRIQGDRVVAGDPGPGDGCDDEARPDRRRGGRRRPGTAGVVA